MHVIRLLSNCLKEAKLIMNVKLTFKNGSTFIFYLQGFDPVDSFECGFADYPNLIVAQIPEKKTFLSERII